MIAWRTSGFRCGNRGLGISGIPVVGNTAQRRSPCMDNAMRRSIVDRPMFNPSPRNGILLKIREQLSVSIDDLHSLSP